MEYVSASFAYVQAHVLAVIVALVVSYIIGFVWHGPLFGKLWMGYNKMTPPKPGEMKFSMMTPGLLANLVFMIALCGVLGITFAAFGITTLWGALMISKCLWFAFIGLSMANSYAWEGKKFGHWLLDAAYYLVIVEVTAAILFKMG